MKLDMLALIKNYLKKMLHERMLMSEINIINSYAEQTLVLIIFIQFQRYVSLHHVMYRDVHESIVIVRYRPCTE